MPTNAPVSANFSVLMVCYANLCRSPLMEAMLQQLADARSLAWNVSSAGVAGRVGLPMHRHAQHILIERGIDVSDFGSRRVQPELLASADLVLTATEATRDFVLRLHPPSLPRTFTLLHFAHLVAGIGEHQDAETYGPWLRDQARLRRAGLQPLAPQARDIADPMGHSRARFRQCASVIEEAVEIVLEPLPGSRWSWRVSDQAR